MYGVRMKLNGLRSYSPGVIWAHMMNQLALKASDNGANSNGHRMDHTVTHDTARHRCGQIEVDRTNLSQTVHLNDAISRCNKAAICPQVIPVSMRRAASSVHDNTTLTCHIMAGVPNRVRAAIRLKIMGDHNATK